MVRLVLVSIFHAWRSSDSVDLADYLATCLSVNLSQFGTSWSSKMLILFTLFNWTKKLRAFFSFAVILHGTSAAPRRKNIGDPQNHIGFNTFEWSNDLDHLKAPLWFWKLHLSKETCKKTSQPFYNLLKSHDQTFAGKAGQNMFFKHTSHSTNTSDNNHVLLVKIEGPFWNTIYIIIIIYLLLKG